MNHYVALFQNPVAEQVGEELSSVAIVEGTYKLSDFAMLIRSVINSPETLSKLLELSEERSGVVFKMNGSYHGYYFTSLWDWLAEDRE